LKCRDRAIARIKEVIVTSARLLSVSIAALALSACVAYIPTGPTPAYAYSSVAPPADQVEVIPASPGAAYVWTPGFYVWGGSGYTWRGGRWVVPPHGYKTWNPGYWAQGPRGHWYTPGHWR
jgi:hypothetical protein